MQITTFLNIRSDVVFGGHLAGLDAEPSEKRVFVSSWFTVRHSFLLLLTKFLHASSQDFTDVNGTILSHGDVVCPKQLTIVVSK
jgi:hypothetical protein